MHSNIIQISRNPIEIDEWVSPFDFYENSSDFADWIGDEKDDEEREGTILWMSSDFGGIFTLEDDHLVFNGLGEFTKEWYEYIREYVSQLKDGEVDDMKLYKIKKAVERTHLGIYSRFYIENWNGYAAPAEDLIDYLQNRMKKGDRLYIGAVIDYHF